MLPINDDDNSGNETAVVVVAALDFGLCFRLFMMSDIMLLISWTLAAVVSWLRVQCRNIDVMKNSGFDEYQCKFASLRLRELIE